MNTFGPKGLNATPSRRSGLWFIRITPLVSTLCLLLAMFVFKSGNHHDFLLGLAAGLLIALSLQSFSIKAIELDDSPQASDVERYPLT